MKLLTPEEEAGHDRATLVGGARSGGLAALVALPAAYLANKRYAYYRNLTPALKAFSMVMVIIPSMVIGAENEGIRYERSLWHDAGKREIDEEEKFRRDQLAQMSPLDQWKTWGKENKYSLVAGSWVVGIAGAWKYSSRGSNQSTTQKLIQTRMIAQAITLVLLLGTAYATYPSPEEQQAPHKTVDHSWVNTLKANEAEQEELEHIAEHMKKNQASAHAPSASSPQKSS